MTNPAFVQTPQVFEFSLTHATLIVAISHRSNFPAIGGMRRISYQSLDHARNDCLYLANGMLLKAQHHDLPLSGGKAVIYCDDAQWLNHRLQIIQEAALKIHSLDGKYITAIDMGTTNEDMDHVALITPHVCSTSDQALTAYATALGVFYGLEEAVDRMNIAWDTCRITIEGLGQVSQHLIPMLHEKGAILTGYDIQPERLAASEPFVKAYENGMPVDVFIPNGSGHTINADRVRTLGCQLICGAANNQLMPGVKAEDLDCVWLPDYLVNAGGLIFVHTARQTDDPKLRMQAIERIKSAVVEHFETHIGQHAN